MRGWECRAGTRRSGRRDDARSPSLLRALRERLPHESIIYLGDTARVPYGTKSTESVVRYAMQATDYLARRGVKVLVVACNTASAVSLDALDQQERDDDRVDAD